MERISDREKLSLAFDDLTQLGYYAPISYAWEICCMACGLSAVGRHLGISDEDEYDAAKFIFWDVQKDGWAFYGDNGTPMPESLHEEAPDSDDDDEWERWFEEHADKIEAAEMEERLSKYNILKQDLHLNWAGDPAEIVAVLRAHGLKALLPDSPERCIQIRTTHSARRCEQHRPRIFVSR